MAPVRWPPTGRAANRCFCRHLSVAAGLRAGTRTNKAIGVGNGDRVVLEREDQGNLGVAGGRVPAGGSAVEVTRNPKLVARPTARAFSVPTQQYIRFMPSAAARVTAVSTSRSAAPVDRADGSTQRLNRSADSGSTLDLPTDTTPHTRPSHSTTSRRAVIISARQ